MSGAETSAQPLSSAEFSALMAPLGPFEPAPHVAVAVSGGADSLSLALLLRDWAAEQGGRVTALVVDHGLRPGSAAEARRVRRQLTGLGLAAKCLTWPGPAPQSNRQALARAARYRLMADWCRRQSVLHLALAHHLDDQAETLLLRLGRGSGLDGLAAMPPLRELPEVRLLRPLLPVPKARLVAGLRTAGLTWVEDPSNRDPSHARVRLPWRARSTPDGAAWPWADGGPASGSGWPSGRACSSRGRSSSRSRFSWRSRGPSPASIAGGCSVSCSHH